MAALYKEQVGARIRVLREERRWSQRHLGDLVRVEANTISRWERGRNLGKGKNLERIAEAFDLSVAAFMGGIHRPTVSGDGSTGGGPTIDTVMETLDRIEAEVRLLHEKLDRLLATAGAMDEAAVAGVADAVAEVERKAKASRRPREARGTGARRQGAKKSQ